jgi:quinol-cytochrome oxidoreductase complex cytochrome b subunit
MVGWYVALGLLAALAALFPWELGEKASPFGSAPEGIKPEWYFLFMFETLKELPPHIFGVEWLEGEVVGVLFFGFCGALILVVPFLDFRSARGLARQTLNLLAAMAIVAFILMTARGFDLFQIGLGTAVLVSIAAGIVIFGAMQWFERRGRMA